MGAVLRLVYVELRLRFFGCENCWYVWGEMLINLLTCKQMNWGLERWRRCIKKKKGEDWFFLVCGGTCVICMSEPAPSLDTESCTPIPSTSLKDRSYHQLAAFSWGDRGLCREIFGLGGTSANEQTPPPHNNPCFDRSPAHWVLIWFLIIFSLRF